MVKNDMFRLIMEESKNNHGEVIQTFERGQENDFCVFLMKWCEELKNALDNETGDYVYYDLALRGVVTNSFNNLDWQSIWSQLNNKIIMSSKPYINGCIRAFILIIKKFISLDSFIEKLQSCDDITSIYFLYRAFFDDEDEFKNSYIKYLSEYVERNNCPYTECFKTLYTGFSTINSRDLWANGIFNLDRNRDADLRKLIDLFIEIPCIRNIVFDEDSDSVIFEDANGQKVYVKC